MNATPLQKKLRLQPNQCVMILNAPEGYIDSLGDLPDGARLVHETEPGTCDFVHVFAQDSNQYAEFGPRAIAAIKYDGILWISYPKKSARTETDLSRDAMWNLLTETGWRPVSQVSIDATWSAVRFRPSEMIGS